MDSQIMGERLLHQASYLIQQAVELLESNPDWEVANYPTGWHDLAELPLDLRSITVSSSVHLRHMPGDSYSTKR